MPCMGMETYMSASSALHATCCHEPCHSVLSPGCLHAHLRAACVVSCIGFAEGRGVMGRLWIQHFQATYRLSESIVGKDPFQIQVSWLKHGVPWSNTNIEHLQVCTYIYKKELVPIQSIPQHFGAHMLGQSKSKSWRTSWIPSIRWKRLTLPLVRRLQPIMVIPMLMLLTALAVLRVMGLGLVVMRRWLNQPLQLKLLWHQAVGPLWTPWKHWCWTKGLTLGLLAHGSQNHLCVDGYQNDQLPLRIASSKAFLKMSNVIIFIFFYWYVIQISLPHFTHQDNAEPADVYGTPVEHVTNEAPLNLWR